MSSYIADPSPVSRLRRRSPRAGVTLLAALLTLLLTLSISGTANASPSPNSAQSTSVVLAQVQTIVDRAPNAGKYTAQQRQAIASELVAFGQQLKEDPALLRRLSQTATAQTDSRSMAPMWYPGVGWYIYLHHLTPSDQRWFMEVGVGVAAAAICAASGGTACAVAAIIAAILIPTISEYYTTRYCMEVEFTWSGRLHRLYYTYC